jgi:hypothetical protein
MKFLVLLTVLLLGMQARVHAQEAAHTYQPANFPADPSRIIRRINFPNSDEDVFVWVFCDASLDRYGNLDDSFCVSEYPDSRPFVRAVMARIDSSRLEPARVDGVTKPVHFQYTVQFERREGVETIKLFPHHFVGVNGSGEGYVGPQRYRGSHKLPCESIYDFWFTMTIPIEGGPPTDITLENAGANDACSSVVRAIVEDSDFIPGFYQGAPVAASFREHRVKIPR